MFLYVFRGKLIFFQIIIYGKGPGNSQQDAFFVVQPFVIQDIVIMVVVENQIKCIVAKQFIQLVSIEFCQLNMNIGKFLLELRDNGG